MRISARCDYACKALLELSLHWPNKVPLQIQQISEKQQIPMRYLVQILIQLKRQGILQSSRGKQGGYNLAISPSEIKLGEVIRLMSGPLLPVVDSAEKTSSIFKDIWQEAEGAVTKILDKVTFEEICKKAFASKTTVVYQI